MKNITHTPVYADIRWGYVRHRLYTFQARSHTVAYAGIRRGRKFFLSMFKNVVRIGRMLYTISILLAHAEYAGGTPDVRYSYAGISKDFCAYENYFINFHTLLIRFSHTQWCDRALTAKIKLLRATSETI